MRTNLPYLIVLFFLFICFNPVYAGIPPTFNMTVKNIQTIPRPAFWQDSIVQWELWLQQTNFDQPGVDEFEYCCGQFTFLCDKTIQNGNLILGLNGGLTSLPSLLRPPTFQVDSLTAPPGQLYLKGSGNNIHSDVNYFISPTFPGTRIVTFRLRTSAKRFPMVPLNLRFKLGPAPNTFVAYFLHYGEQDSVENPNQTAVALLDTVSNIYFVENSGYILPTTDIKIKLTALFEGKYNSSYYLMSKRDTINVYLRSAASPFNLVDSAKGVIDSVSFFNNFTFSRASSGSYYIVVKHKQCVETWSKSGGENLVRDNSIYNFDLTSASTQAYWNNLILKGSKYCLYSGDVDQNGFINLTDVLYIYNDVGSFVSGSVANDLTGDNLVDLNDLLIALNNFIRLRRP